VWLIFGKAVQLQPDGCRYNGSKKTSHFFTFRKLKNGYRLFTTVVHTPYYVPY
jgi:hypothetical protein